MEKNTSKQTPNFSIIVAPQIFPNSNLENLLKSTKYISAEYEIIIVTHGQEITTDNRQILEMAINSNHKCCRVVIATLKSDLGLAYARNEGTALASSNLLFYSDDDILLTEDITPLIGHLKNNTYQSIQPLILRYPDLKTIDSAGDRIIRLHGIYHAIIRGANKKLSELTYKLEPEQLPSLRGAFFAIRKDVLERIGGFDDSLGFNFDDVDLGWRMTIAGYKNVFLPSIKVAHIGGRTTNPIASDKKNMRYHLVNHHAIQFKVSGFTAWLFILMRFQFFAIKNARQKGTIISCLQEVMLLNKMLIERFHNICKDRKLLNQLNREGNSTFKAMVNQKRRFLAASI